jgi:transcriptional regulator with GAF, ATPase, and Fis domain
VGVGTKMMNIGELQSSSQPEPIGMIGLQNEVRLEWRFKEIVGRSTAMERVLNQIEVAAPTDCTVLITGETGTGKERFARAIHEHSRRSGRAFVSVNCGALAPSLVSSELFGHERGAFTGAVQRRLGRFEMAHSGTIFLDEVGELSPETQVALLRVLQEREFERVGGTQSVRVDVRIIAATNRDLRTEISKGNFRSDLYYRLNVFPIDVPPLRERKDDIGNLLEYFVKQYAKRAGKNIRFIENKTFELFINYDWPGNVRELQNMIERAVILTSGDVLLVDAAWFFQECSQTAVVCEPAVIPSKTASLGTGKQIGDAKAENSTSLPASGTSVPLAPASGTLKDTERTAILQALEQVGWVIGGPKGAASKLGLPRTTLIHRMEKLGIYKARPRSSPNNTEGTHGADPSALPQI